MKKKKYKEIEKHIIFRGDRELELIRKTVNDSLLKANEFFCESIGLGVKPETIAALSTAYNNPKEYCKSSWLAGIDPSDIPILNGIRMKKEKFYDEMLQKPDIRIFCELANDLRKLDFRIAISVLEIKDHKIIFSETLMKKRETALTIFANIEIHKEKEFFLILQEIASNFSDLTKWASDLSQGERILNYILRHTFDKMLEINNFEEKIWINPQFYKDIVSELH